MEVIIFLGVVWLLYALFTSGSKGSGAAPRDGGRARPVASRATSNLSSGADSVAALIQRAINAEKALAFRYIDQDGEITHRTVTPNYLEHRHENNVLCLVAYCHLRGASRTFVVRRMQKVSIQ
jgi:predicted DNA-binding transcriptional regulator YafY